MYIRWLHLFIFYVKNPMFWHTGLMLWSLAKHSKFTITYLHTPIVFRWMLLKEDHRIYSISDINSWNNIYFCHLELIYLYSDWLFKCNLQLFVPIEYYHYSIVFMLFHELCFFYFPVWVYTIRIIVLKYISQLMVATFSDQVPLSILSKWEFTRIKKQKI